MAQALYFAVLPAMLLCIASGHDFSCECPYPIKLATEISDSTKINITCTLKTSAFTSVKCHVTPLTEITFKLNNSEGSISPWCKADTSPCPNNGMVQSTGSSLPSSCGCDSDNGTYKTFTMTIHPTLDLQGGTFFADTNCTGSVPEFVDKDNHCKDIIPEFTKPCEPHEFWDEESVKCVTNTYFILFIVFFILLVIMVIFFVFIVINTYKKWDELKRPLWIARMLDSMSKTCGCAEKTECSRPMQTNTVRPEEGSSTHLSTSHRKLPVPNTKQSTAASRLDPLDHGKTNMATDQSNPDLHLSPRKLAPIPPGKNA